MGGILLLSFPFVFELDYITVEISLKKRIVSSNIEWNSVSFCNFEALNF